MAQEVTTARERSTANAGNAVRGDVRTVGGVTENGYSAPLKRAILSYENSHRREEVEHIAVYDDEGNQLSHRKGTQDSVNLYPKDVPRESLILTHNHPDGLFHDGVMSIGNSFSLEDMKLALKYNAKEIRAVTPSYTFSIKRNGDSWGVTSRQITKAFKAAEARVTAEGQSYADRIGFSKTVNERYHVTYFHKINKLVAKELGWNYTKKKG